MNLIVLGAVSVPVGWMLGMYILYFIPPKGGAGGAGSPGGCSAGVGVSNGGGGSAGVVIWIFASKQSNSPTNSEESSIEVSGLPHLQAVFSGSIPMAYVTPKMTATRVFNEIAIQRVVKITIR